MRLLALWFSLGIGNQREPTVQLRELYSMLSSDLNGKEIQKTEDMRIHTVDTLCWTAETNSRFKATVL